MSSFSLLVGTSRRVAATAARRAKVGEVAAFLSSLAPADIGAAAQYLAGETLQGRMGIGYAALRAAAASAPAESPHLTILEVDRALAELSAIRGARAASRRADALGQLFARASSAEQAFLLPLLAGELRQGAQRGIMIEAIAEAARLTASEVRRAAMYAPGLAALARAALLEGSQGLRKFQLELFSPVAPMLAQSAADVAQALEQLGAEAAFEWKMDGARVQVHKEGAEIRIYSRALNEVTHALPDLVEAVRAVGPRTLVLDGEAIAFDASGRPHPFQITMRRFGRKLKVEQMRSDLPIRAFYFDCLRIEDRSIAELPARERFRALRESIPSSLLMPRLVTSELAEASAFYDSALAAGHEGLMAKSLEAPYEAGNRGAGWLKIKRAHTLDLAVLAAEWGHGRRAGKLSNLHLGALDVASGRYVMLGKTFKGLTDAMLEWQTRELLARETHRDQSTVYVRPELVVEIAFSDVQASTRYPGGVALRLARVKRYRTDKRPEEADTMDAVRGISGA